MILIVFILTFSTDRKWGDKLKRRKYFDQLAMSLGFDPGDRERWYSVTSIQVKKMKVCPRIFIIILTHTFIRETMSLLIMVHLTSKL
jgi:hypothetical protein